MIIVRLPSTRAFLVGFAPPKFTRASEPALLWNQSVACSQVLPAATDEANPARDVNELYELAVARPVAGLGSQPRRNCGRYYACARKAPSEFILSAASPVLQPDVLICLCRCSRVIRQRIEEVTSQSSVL